MKNNKALAIALSAGLVLGGAFVADTTNVAYAASVDDVEDQKAIAIANIGNKPNLTNAQREAAITSISQAQTIEDVNNAVATANAQAAANAEADAKGNSESSSSNEAVSTDYLLEYLKPVVNFSKLTQEEKENFEKRMRAAQTPGEVYDIYLEAEELNRSRTVKPSDEEKEEVTLKGTFHFPGSNGQDATFTGVDGKDAYAKLRDYAYSFEKEFGEPSIMKNDDDTYDIYYDLYVKPVEKEDFTITVKVFKPFAKEDDYYASATFTSDRYDGDYDKAMADVWNWADAQSGPRRYRAEVVNKYEIHIHELEGEKASIPWTELIPARPIIVDGDDNKPFPVNPTPVDPVNPTPVDPVNPTPVDPITPVDPVNPTPVVPIKPVNPVGPTDDEPVVDTTSKEVDDLIKELDDRTEEIQKELEKIDSTITDDNQKPADEDKKPVDDKKPSDEDKKPSNEDDDANAQPSKDKVVVKDIIKEVKEAVRVPAASHNNPKTGVADLSAVAGTLAISMAGIVATRKKND